MYLFQQLYDAIDTIIYITFSIEHEKNLRIIILCGKGELFKLMTSTAEQACGRKLKFLDFITYGLVEITEEPILGHCNFSVLSISSH